MATIPSQSPPNATVYVRNLEERIKIPQLTEALSEIFSEYGNIVDIVAKTNLKAKGQAFIVFDNVESASKAIEEVNGFELFDKPMTLDYAKTRSDQTVLREEGEDGLEKWKRHRLAEKERKQALEALDTTNPHKLKRPGATLATPSTTAGGIKSSTIASSATTRGAGLKPSGPSTTSGVIPDEYLPPNKILFLRELPESYDAERLSAIFASFEGFKEVRTVPNRKGIAFVEYEGEQGAISAKEATGGMQLEDKRIRVTYQRQ